MHRDNRLISLLLSASLIFSCTFSGCNMLAQTKESEEKKLPSKTIETTLATSTPTPSPTPTPDPNVLAKDEAIALAKEYEIPESSLRGKYDLFLRFSSEIKSNGNLGDFVPYVYNLFPIVADHLKEENESYFLAKVGTLRIICGVLKDDRSGEYTCSTNIVKINKTYLTDETVPFAGTVMHELMHFLDSHIDGPLEKVTFTKENIYPINDIPVSDNSVLIHSDEAAFFMEAGAELYNAKYFMHYTWSYTSGVQFLTGLEYIFSCDLIEEAFFRHDSAWVLADLMQQNGFSIQEIITFYKTMDCISYKRLPSEEVLRPEDVLIRLYEKNIDGDYKQDKIFCHILRCINNKFTDFKHFPSAYEEFLTSIAYSDDKAKAWSFSLFEQVYINDFPNMQMYRIPVSGIFLDGEYRLSAEISELNEDDTVKGTEEAAIFSYDFETDTVTNFDLYSSPINKIKRPEIK